jgi:putative redox protein
MTIKLNKSETGQYRQTLHIDEHTIFADVASSLGGDGSAPDPHDFYDAALAACKAITLMMYAKRKNMPLQGVDVEISRDTSHEAQGEYVLHCELHLRGELDAEQRVALFAIADKCPIHKLMTSATTTVKTHYK